MALFGWSLSSFSLLQSHKHSSIPKPSISKTLIPVSTTTNRKIHPVSISSASPGLRYPCLRCCATDDESSSTRIFIKGLPQSTCEGSLKKAFSQFGEVSKVRIKRNKISSQPLGFAFAWFTTEESAQLAVKMMDGKFFHGRFVFVKIAKPGPSKGHVKAAPYKF
ncbi:hypothetical protein PVL29_005846 [Vitis rotundifolia]|uniref:RRM domain-containing protein n=1 Tax=Vitis rotundifolia TaxID=103349 RepID=A0AA39A468_VITRO|nr:hypothetical protein PVL29_005846 [Vitis rotundifolia]